MERVQFQQEQMLAELKDLEQKGLFSQTEVKSIMKKRTAFESALVRRVPKKGDFLRYAAYEMSLEALRRRRLKRLNLPAIAPSISDFALVRRQFHIFERALRKFKADVALWVQYIELGKREGARALVGRICARALQLHPNEPALYISAAQHELENLSPAAARALLQRGIRLNKENVSLWTEYVKFELGFVEGLRRRWNVLGVVGDVNETNVEDAMEDTSEEARTEIMRGAIVMAVICEAAKANPQLPLFRSLHELLSTYPTPLRASFLDYLHTLLVQALPDDPAALKLHATRLLPTSGDLETSEDFVDNLKAANEELLDRARSQRGAAQGVYVDFVEEWCQRDLDPNLRLYLVCCLQSLTSLSDIGSWVLAAHVRLLSVDVRHLEKAVRCSRKYTRRASGDAEVWLARLDAERLAGVADDEVARAWGEARRRVDGEGRERVWMWGLREDGNAKDICEGLLRESIGEGSLHVTLLIYYVTRILHRVGTAPAASIRMGNMRRVVSAYLGTGRFFRAAFKHEAELADSAEKVLELLYEEWRRCEGEEVEANLAWADWLRKNEQGSRAAEIIAKTQGAEAHWSRTLDIIGHDGDSLQGFPEMTRNQYGDGDGTGLRMDMP